MKRKITEQLVAWKNRPGHKPLILQGARQVGKSYILEKFGEEHYKNYVRVSLDLVPDVQSRTVQQTILNGYDSDMGKYANPATTVKIKA